MQRTNDELFLYSTFSMPYLLDSNNQYSTVEVSGSAIDDGYLSYNDNDLDEDNDVDNIIRKEKCFWSGVLSIWHHLTAPGSWHLVCLQWRRTLPLVARQ